MANMTYIYDEDTGRYIVKNARILFPNFQGAEQDYNMPGKRNFRLQVDKDLADELQGRGVNVRYREARDDMEDDQYLIKVGIYSDAEIRLLSGKAMTKVLIDNDNHGMPTKDDQGSMVDAEFRKGHIKNGEISLEFHVSKNTRVATSSPYIRLDTMIIPIRKSRLLEEYDEIEEDVFGD